MAPNHAILSIGTNHTDRDSRIAEAIQWLSGTFRVRSCSEVYEMPAINGTDRPYLNAVAAIDTDTCLPELIDLLKRYETQCGRTPHSKTEGVIPIDIDVIIWNGTIMRPREFAYDYFTKGYRQLSEATKCNAPVLSDR